MGEWISMKDRLPNTDDYYLVCDANSLEAPRIAYYDTSSGWYDCAVTHWMKLPELPEKRR